MDMCQCCFISKVRSHLDSLIWDLRGVCTVSKTANIETGIGKGVRFFVGRWHPPNLPTSDSCAWQQQPIKGGTTPCILSQELGIEWMVIILSTRKSPNRFSTMLLEATPLKKKHVKDSRVFARVSHGVSIEYLLHSNQHLWYLISHSTPFFLEQVIALPWPTSHYEPSLFFRTPPNNLEISGVKRVQRSLKSWISTHRPMTQRFSPQFPPPPRCFPNLYEDHQTKMEHSLHQLIHIYTLWTISFQKLEHTWTIWIAKWSECCIPGAPNTQLDCRTKRHRQGLSFIGKNHRFSIWLFNRDPCHS